MNKERRQNKRIRFESRVRIITEDKTISAEADSRDISLMGMYLIPEKKIALDTLCTLKIILKGKSSAMDFTIHGKICRHDDRGMGIVFLDMKEDSFVHIKNLIMLHTADGTAKKPPIFPYQEG